MNAGQAAVVKRVAVAMMRGQHAAREEEREVFPRKVGQERTNYHRHSIEGITCNKISNYQ